MSLRWVALGLLSLATVVACGGSGSPEGPTTMPPVQPPAMPGTPPPVSVSMPSGASALTVSAYVPNPVTVAVGTTITWVNNDTLPHTVSSQTNAWDSGNID